MDSYSIRNLVVLRMKFFSLRMNREDGPDPNGSRLPLRRFPMRRFFLEIFCKPRWSKPASFCSRARLACSAAANLEREVGNRNDSIKPRFQYDDVALQLTLKERGRNPKHVNLWVHSPFFLGEEKVFCVCVDTKHTQRTPI